jgi:hypothetical protein
MKKGENTSFLSLMSLTKITKVTLQRGNLEMSLGKSS